MAEVDDIGAGGTSESAFDRTGGPVSQDLVHAVAAYRGVDPTELAPLYTSIDPDALNALFSPPRSPVELTFRYEGLAVTVSGDGIIQITGLE